MVKHTYLIHSQLAHTPFRAFWTCSLHWMCKVTWLAHFTASVVIDQRDSTVFFPNGTKICRGAFELLSIDTIIIIFSNCICKITVLTIFFLFLEYDDSCTKGKRWLEWGPWCKGEYIYHSFLVYFLTFNRTELLSACNHRVPQVFPDLQDRWGLRWAATGKN